MIDKRPFASLGGADHGWLKAKHHFSFADYHDPKRMGWGPIRVWNDDEIAPGTGFPPHAHSDMEIITFVRQGAITHKDSLGNEGRTAAGDVQVMSAALASATPSTTSSRASRRCSRSGSSRHGAAAPHPGAHANFPRTIALAASPSWRAESRATTPSPSAPTRGWPA
jgi:hypothetical protein